MQIKSSYIFSANSRLYILIHPIVYISLHIQFDNHLLSIGSLFIYFDTYLIWLHSNMFALFLSSFARGCEISPIKYCDIQWYTGYNSIMYAVTK